MTVFGSGSKARTFDYRAGDVGYPARFRPWFAPLHDTIRNLTSYVD